MTTNGDIDTALADFETWLTEAARSLAAANQALTDLFERLDEQHRDGSPPCFLPAVSGRLADLAGQITALGASLSRWGDYDDPQV